jgi:hypothetical protein
MKVKLAALSTILIASASFSLQPASAQQRQERGARFPFAPNIWKLEEPRIPKENYGMSGHPMRSDLDGKVPHGPSFLGFDPQLLARPVVRPIAPVTRTQVAMRPGVAPTQNVTSPFKQSFGAPAAPPEMAQPNSLPNAAKPAALPQSSNANNKALSGKLVPGKGLSANRSVSGVLRGHKRPAGQSANPALALTKPVETYGKNFGFVPGIVLPIASNSGRTSSAEVSGRVLSHHKSGR